MKSGEFQTAYQKENSCDTQIFHLRTVTVTFIDLEKAFNRIRKTNMQQIIYNNCLGQNMLNAIKNLYSNTKIGNFKSAVVIGQRTVSSIYIH